MTDTRRPQSGPQSRTFLEGEGDAWFNRNRDSLVGGADLQDPVIDALTELQVEPRRVLEVGCSDGYRLDALQRATGAECHGIDPSAEAVRSGARSYPQVHLRQGVAHELPYADGHFDTLIYGFCLYLCDRSDLFMIAAQADRVLEDRGLVVIYDFYPSHAYRNVYTHRPGVYSFKMDHARMLLWNPAYSLVHRKVFQVQGSAPDDVDARLSVTTLRKDLAAAWPDGGQG